MGGDDHRGPYAMEPLEDAHDVDGEVRVEIARGFVGDEDGRPRDHGAGNTDALLFAGGQFHGEAGFAAEQAHLVQCSPHALVDFAARHPIHDERQGHVVEHGAVVEQFVVLEDHADMAAERRDGGACQFGDFLAPDNDFAPGGAFDGSDEFQQGALAGTAVTGEKDHLARVHMEAGIHQGLAAGGIAFPYAFEADHGGSPAPVALPVPNKPSTNASASKGAKSSMLSPRPTKRTGRPSS